MKKILIATAFALGAGLASAADISVQAVNDHTANKAGVRAEAAIGQLGFVTPRVQLTHIQDVYTRLGVVGTVPLGEVGPMKVGATVGGHWEDNKLGPDGYGVSVGARVSYDVTKRVTVLAGVERVMGQDRVQPNDGNVVSVGLAVKF